MHPIVMQLVELGEQADRLLPTLLVRLLKISFDVVSYCLDWLEPVGDPAK